MYTLSIKGKMISIFPSLEVNAPLIYPNTFSDEDQEEIHTFIKAKALILSSS